MSEDFFAHHLATVPVIAILRGHSPEETVTLAERCWDAGISLVEVPAQGAPGFEALEAAADAAAKRGWFVGAGTVYRVSDASRARDAGAQFLVAPGLSAETVAAVREWGMPYLPGVQTPSEVQIAITLGVRTLKLFPAASLGPSWISALRGPFPDISLIAVGGVCAANAQTLLDAGALGVGVGGALGSPHALDDLASLRRT